MNATVCNITACITCRSAFECAECNHPYGFRSDGPSCAVPLELVIQQVFKVVLALLLVMIVAAIVGKAVLLCLYAAKERVDVDDDLDLAFGSILSTGEVEQQVDQVAGQYWRDDVKTLTQNAVMHAFEQSKYARNMDWVRYVDGRLPEDAAYKHSSFGEGSDEESDEESEYSPVPREYPTCVNVHSEALLGVGLPLFFNFHFLPLVASVVLFAAVWWSEQQSGLRDVLLLVDEESSEQLSNAVAAYAKAMWYSLGGAHLVLFVISMGFCCFQWRFAKQFDASNSTMQDYGIVLHNLPRRNIWGPDLQKLLEAQFGIKLVGVSMLVDCKAKVWGIKVPSEMSSEGVEGLGTIKLVDESCEGAEEQGTVGNVLWAMMERLIIDYDARFKQATVDGLDNQFQFGYPKDLVLEDDKKDLKDDKERFHELINSGLMHTGGHAGVIFKCKKDMARFYDQTKDGFKLLVPRSREESSEDGDVDEEDEEKLVTPDRPLMEPPGVEWFNFGAEADSVIFRRSLVAGAKLMFFLVVVCLVVYVPINRDISLPYVLIKANPQPLTMQCIGIINALIGGLFAPILFTVAGGVGYRFKFQFDGWCLRFVMVISITNFVVGNYCVLHRRLKAGFGAVDIFDVNSDAVHAELRLADFYFDMLVPGMIFTGWFIGKLMGDIWPFVQHYIITYIVFIVDCFPDKINAHLAVLIPWNPRVLAKDGVTRVPLSARAAEYIWTPKILSIAWEYPEKIFTPTICILSLFAIGTWKFTLFALLFAWTLLVYCWHRFIQFHTYAKYMNSTVFLEMQAQRCWSMPLGVLATAWCWWGSRLGYFSWKWACPVAFLVSCGGFHLGLECIKYRYAPQDLYRKDADDSDDEEEDYPYEDTARRLLYSWFNCNPFHVLASHYAPEKVYGEQGGTPLPLAPFLYGKEYLVLDQNGRA